MMYEAVLALILPLLTDATPINRNLTPVKVERQFPGTGSGFGGGFPGLPSGGFGGGAGGGFPGFPSPTSFSLPGPTGPPSSPSGVPGSPGGGSGGGGATGGGSSTANDLTNGVCRPVTLIFARGTSEPGNVGSVVGPPLISALQSTLGASNLAAQGVDYPADAQGNIPGAETQGPDTMASLAQQAVQQCAGTQVVLGGYSQGATVTHDAAKQLSGNVTSAIKAIVLFGDPENGQAINGVAPSNVDTFCAQGDSVCEGSFAITPAHLSYGSDATPAAQFVAGKVTV